jgi:GTP cyclohydrolase II
VAFRVPPDVHDHLALVLGDVQGGTAADPVAVRVHSECLTGEALGSLRCDCGRQLDSAMERIAAAGRGVLVYLRGHEGRGIGLAAKLRAYALQEDGLDTVDANVALGHPVDARDFTPAAAVLLRLGIAHVDLMTHNPAKTAALRAAGIDTRAGAPPSTATPHNARYLDAKRTRLGHTDLTRP